MESHPKQKTSADISKAMQAASLQEIEIGPQDLMLAAAVATATAHLQSSNFIAKEIGELTEKLKGTSEENAKLRDKIKIFKKENATMQKKISVLEDKNQQQTETISSLGKALEKLQKDLDTVIKSKDILRIEVEQKNAAFITENKILTEKLEVLKQDFEVVESENKDLKRFLAELRSDNTGLKETVSTIQEENKKLQSEMGKLREGHEKIRENLDAKETRLALGQVAYLLEAEIWKIVLPNIPKGDSGVLYSMNRWLKKNSKSNDGKAAQKRWDELKSKLNWNDDDHYDALKILKKQRIKDAHPSSIDLEEASKQLREGNYIAEPDKNICQEIIDMITTAKSLNQSKQ